MTDVTVPVVQLPEVTAGARMRKRMFGHRSFVIGFGILLVIVLIALFAPLLAGAAVVFVPLLDLLMAVVRRTRKGMSPFSPDKMHLHHRLLEIGHSHRRAVLLIYLWAAVLAYGAVALALVGDRFLVLSAVGIGLVVAVLASAVPRLRAPR